MMNKFFMAALASIALLAACKDDEEPNTEKPEDGNYTGLVLNEICGGDSNSDDDWVEIYNTSSVAINLQGVTITKIDEDGISEKLYTYPEGATLAAGAYDVKSRTSNELAAKISNSKQVSIVLEMPSGTQIDIFDKDTEVGENGSHSLGGSYARIPDDTGKWTIVSKATKGAANSDEAPEVTEGDYSGLVLNELNGNDPKYIELYNFSDKEIDLTGVQLKKDDDKIVYIAPEGTTLAAHGYLVLYADAANYEEGFTSGLSAKKAVKIELLSPKGELIDVFKNLTIDGTEEWGEDPKYNGDDAGQAYGRQPDGTGKWYLIDSTEGSSNDEAAKGEEISW